MKPTLSIVITGRFITDFLRASKTPYEDAGCAGMSLTVQQIKDILEERATITGDSSSGLTLLYTRDIA